jgi:hypothetical protein
MNFKNLSLAKLIELAYDVKDYQISARIGCRRRGRSSATMRTTFVNGDGSA